VYKHSSGRIITIYASKNEAVCREVRTDFRSISRASFIKKDMGAISRFLHPKTKLFVVEFRRVLEVYHEVTTDFVSILVQAS